MDLLTGQTPSTDTPDDKMYLADAKVLVTDIRNRYAWVGQTAAAQFPAVFEGVKDRLLEIVVTKSKNRELNHSLY